MGDYKNDGREWEPSGKPVQVQGHDFPTGGPEGRPLRIYDIANNAGNVSVGQSAETAEFSVASIQAWWEHLGHQRFPTANRLTITADCGGGNSPRVHLWKLCLQKLADETGLELELELRHFPRGTSEMEHSRAPTVLVHQPQLARAAGGELRGDPRVDLPTTTSTGLKVYARLDPTIDANGTKVTKDQIAAVNITAGDWHPEWNYRISPGSQSP